MVSNKIKAKQMTSNDKQKQKQMGKIDTNEWKWKTQKTKRCLAECLSYTFL